jgi:indolepyruvate ferredoxin oxidoreductase beta subunit
MAGSGRLPIPVETFDAAIRADGMGVEGNLRGFHAGLDGGRARTQTPPVAAPKTRAAGSLAALEQAAQAMPALAQPIVLEGVRRLTAYQNPAYAQLYLDHLAPFAHGDEKLLKETARHLAVRMSYEDVIRVAQAKIAPERIARIAADELKTNGEPFSVHDFLKPGIEELCQVLPNVIARPIMRLAEQRGWLGRVHFGMEINTTSVSGYLRFLMLAKLRPLRRHGYRYPIEQTQIDSWLALISDTAKLSPTIALEVAECARLIKGYGDTHKRGTGNFARITEALIRPALEDGRAVPPEAIKRARDAALADPDGKSLGKVLAEVAAPAQVQAAQ